MNQSDITFLLSAAGQAWLEQLKQTAIGPTNHLQLVSRLRRQVAPAFVPALLETALLRQKGRIKFSRADAMFFTRAALEQASSELVATHRARRFAAAGLTLIADLGCGIGADSLALAAGAAVIGVDRDETRLRLARLNLAAYERENAFQPLLADLTELSPLPVSAFFFDPARREESGRRIFNPTHYEPSLTLLPSWRKVVPHGAVKLGPGIDFSALPADGEIELVSLMGEVKEAVLWLGELRGAAERRATLLPAGDTLTDRERAITPIGGPVGAFLYEPAGAVIRAGLVAHLAAQIGATFIDPLIAYLTAPELRQTPFARVFTVEDVFPFQLKRLRTYLRQRHIGHAVIKKRGSPLEPDRLRAQLRLSGDNSATIFLTRVGQEPLVIVGQPLAPVGAQ